VPPHNAAWVLLRVSVQTNSNQSSRSRTQNVVVSPPRTTVSGHGCERCPGSPQFPAIRLRAWVTRRSKAQLADAHFERRRPPPYEQIGHPLLWALRLRNGQCSSVAPSDTGVSDRSRETTRWVLVHLIAGNGRVEISSLATQDTPSSARWRSLRRVATLPLPGW
jgi:hypothetical protein